MTTETTAICLLLEKPAEPLILPKGENDVLLELPDSYYYDKKNLELPYEVSSNEVIKVKNISIPQDMIKDAMNINNFSHFIPQHMDTAEKLIKLFQDAEDLEDLLSLASFCRERLTPVLFNYVLSVAVLHRNDSKEITLPNFLLSFPGRFVEASVFSDARMEATLLDDNERQPIVINKNFTASDREPEQAVAYFREDIGINLHHWHWHLVYPSRGSAANKDRRGELFYYMHQQVLARYNTERLCNNMPMVKSLNNLRERIPEAYFSKLSQNVSNRAWPPRVADAMLNDLNRPSDGIYLSISDVEDWIETVKQAIRDGFVYNNNFRQISLNTPAGIDILGNMIEATSLSVNGNVYGNIHNLGHVLIAYCHDPQDRFLESFSLMGDVTTAMRDPIFYRWHSEINDLFVSHKKTLPPYTEKELIFNNIIINSLQVNNPNGNANEIDTFWELSDIDISRGLDFINSGPLLFRIIYLQHGQFSYSLEVNNTSNIAVNGTVRIFMAPKYDIEQNVQSFENQRQLMIEMDKFMVNLRPGINTIQRQSSDSSVTIDYDKTYRDVSISTSAQTFCGCGWPDNMLVPKGTFEGYDMELFAMVSDYNMDRINQTTTSVCPGADSYCGLFSRKYPDARSMGYPFDRSAPRSVLHLSDFIEPNMIVTQVKIKHNNKRVSRVVVDGGNGNKPPVILTQ